MSRLKRLLTEPAKRPQLILWCGVVLTVLAAFVAVSTIGTSVNWFCTGPCHIVHDDNTMTFEKSSHVMLSCVACHEPVNASPLTFVLKKLEVLPDAFPTIFKTFELPMNENHSLAFEMPDEQCTQCHNLENRTVTTSPGIIMNHGVHANEGVSCTSCHNRVAHPEEDVEYVLEGDRKHEDWMVMDACFRCHSLEAGALAPGECAKCHPADFDLVPASHYEPGWYQEFGESGGHAAAASEETSRVASAAQWAAGFDEVKHRETLDMGYERSVNTCFTCHAKQFCTDCHGIEMPHPEGFATDHGAAGTQNPQACARCHARSANEAEGKIFCNACHHPQSTPDKTWIQTHFEVVKIDGAQPCFECHNPRYCSACHVGGPEAAARYVQENAGK
ncbi:MAG: hypothetical protein EG823_02700 [Actinobacteria bacterium]|nr:hypothetical protein [Actinomycetota bacterium]